MMRPTEKQWVQEWRKVYHDLRWNQRFSEQRALREARRIMVEEHGPCPEEPKPNGLKAALLRLIGGVVMPKSLKTFLNRWGVVISVIYVALNALLKILAESGVEWAAGVAMALAAIFALLGLSPLEPTLAGAVMTGVASAWALYGASRKVASEVRKARAHPALRG